MTTKHTPGPWRAVIRANQAGPNAACVDLPLSMGSWRLHRPGDHRVNETDAANARLIAAAPDLLETLQHVLAGALSLPRFAEDAARAAIKSATEG